MPEPLKIAVTGAAGLLGCGLVRVLGKAHEVFGLTRDHADIRDRASITSAVAQLKPQVVIHCAGIASPDVCETQPAFAFAVNVEGTKNVLHAAQNSGASLALISTDAVFDGRKGAPYTESDHPNPLSVYGRTKVRAEEIVLASPETIVFRVSVLFGRDKIDFISKGLLAAARGETYVVASDQYGSATYIDDAAPAMLYAIGQRAFGIYHVANTGACTREELARTAVEIAGLDPKAIVGRRLWEMKRPGPRVPYSVLSMSALERIGTGKMRSWQKALLEYIAVVGPGLSHSAQQELAGLE
jgi:dTDP-4-dehydrorhamnose reductase